MPAKTVAFRTSPVANWTPPGGTTPEPPALAPGASTTGPTNLGALVASGSLTITTPDTVLENLDVIGRIAIKANNVTVRNFRITATGQIFGLKSYSGYSGIVLEDGEITGSSGALLVGSGITARRLNLHHGGSDGVNPYNDFLMDACWLHHLGTAEGSHADGVQIALGSNFAITGNYFDMPIDLFEAGQEYRSNAALFINPTGATPIRTVSISGNWLNAGNYTIYCMGDSDGVSIANNLFGRNYRYDVKRLTASGTVTWSNNRWLDTNAEIA
jgi:hypothetical protein